MLYVATNLPPPLAPTTPTVLPDLPDPIKADLPIVASSPTTLPDLSHVAPVSSPLSTGVKGNQFLFLVLVPCLTDKSLI